MKHAEIQVGEYKIPLLGVPADAVEYTCDGCRNTFHILQLQLNTSGNKFLCENCRIKKVK